MFNIKKMNPLNLIHIMGERKKVPLTDVRGAVGPNGEQKYHSHRVSFRFNLATFLLLASSLWFSTAFAASSPYGEWKRPNGSIAKVWDCDGKMCGEVIAGRKAGFVMFRGIDKISSNIWKGDMKHPKMGNLFTFNGTVTLSGDKMDVQGCMIGGSMCDAETWVK